jgi:hypothetical protein
MISRRRSSGGTPGLVKSSGPYSEEEQQKLCWLVAVRRCLEFSRAQQKRAELLSGFPTIRYLSARVFLEVSLPVP